MKVKYFIILIGLLLASGACKKGEMGPQGLQGEKGDAGDTGLQGVKGADGSVIYSGTTVPAATIGKNGDYYFRKNTGDFYGPKTASGWGSATNLKGTNGTNGTNGKDGSQFLSGTDIPAVSLGKVGDFYFNTSQMVLYGPKTATGWGVGTNLKADAKIMYSGWIAAVRFKDTVMDNTQANISHIYSPQITEAVMSSAVVLMYLDYGGGTFQLPYTSRAGGRMSTIAFKPKRNELIVYRFVYDGGSLVSLSSNIRYRYVIIPGNYFVALKKRNVNLRDPQEVEKALSEMKE